MVKASAILTRILLGCAFLVGASSAHAQTPEKLRIEPLKGHLATPERLDVNAARFQQLKLPAGFQIQVFAQGLGNPRNLAVAPDGTVYVTRRKEGDVLALKDTNGDGRANQRRTVMSGVKYVNGITIHQNHLYFVTDTQLYRTNLLPGGRENKPQLLLKDLPDAGQHPNRTLGVGPDGMLYISVGSTCNACDEPNKEHATLLRSKLDGSDRTIFARGLRNTIGFAWHPHTKELWGMDHGSDWRGEDQPPEEVNLLREGNHYGWPFCWGDRQPDLYLPADPENMSKQDFCAQKTAAPVLTYQAHSAPLDFIFYTASQFPSEYQNSAFVTMRGSWNRNPPVGYKVVRLRYQNGKPVGFEDFVTGFLAADGKTQFGRPVGLATMTDGSLLFTDDTNGMIYRVSYKGKN